MHRCSPAVLPTASLLSGPLSSVAATAVSACCAPVLVAGRLFSSRAPSNFSSMSTPTMRRVGTGSRQYCHTNMSSTFSTRRFFSSTSSRRAQADSQQQNSQKKPMNPFKTLGLKPSASEEEIKKAYRVLAKKNHPDLGGNPEKFMQIREAYDLVKDGNYVPPSTGPAGVDETTGRPHASSRWDSIYYKDGNSGDILSADKVRDMLRKGKSFSWENPAENPFSSGKGASPRSTKRSNLAAERYDAWCRLLVIWSGFLVTARVALFSMFPPNFKFLPQHAHLSEEERVAIQARQKKRVAPPRPLTTHKKTPSPPSAASLFGRPVVA